MDVEFAFLADAADSPSNGKLYVLGAGIDELRATSFPTVHPYMALVVKLKLHPTECDIPHRLRIDLWDQDGKPTGASFQAEVTAARNPANPGREVFVQLVANLVGVVFPTAGDYGFHISVDERHIRTVVLHLVTA